MDTRPDISQAAFERLLDVLIDCACEVKAMKKELIPMPARSQTGNFLLITTDDGTRDIYIPNILYLQPLENINGKEYCKIVLTNNEYFFSKESYEDLILQMDKFSQ